MHILDFETENTHDYAYPLNCIKYYPAYQPHTTVRVFRNGIIISQVKKELFMRFTPSIFSAGIGVRFLNSVSGP